MDTILIDIAKLSPVLALMSYVIYYLKDRYEEREKTLESRITEKESKLYELHDKTITAIQNNTIATNALTESLKKRPKI